MGKYISSKVRDDKLEFSLALDEKAKNFKQKFDEFNCAFTGEDPSIPAKQREDASNIFWKNPENADKTLLGGFYRDIEDRKKIRLAYALTHGMTWKDFYAGNDESHKKMAELGKKFDALYMHDPRDTPDERLEKDRAAMMDLKDIYNTYTKKSAYGFNLDTISDQDLLDHYEDVQMMNAPFEISSFISKTKTPVAYERFIEVMGKEEEENFSRGISAEAVTTELSTALNKRTHFLRSESYREFLKNPEEYALQKKGLPVMQDQNLLNAEITYMTHSPGWKESDAFPMLSDTTLETVLSYSQKWADQEMKKNGADSSKPEAFFQNPENKEISTAMVRGALYLQNESLFSIQNPGSQVPEPGKSLVKINDAALSNARRRISLQEGMQMSFRKFGNMDPLKFKKNAGKGTCSDIERSYGVSMYENHFGVLYSNGMREKLADAGISEMDCIFINGKSARELYGKKFGGDESKMKAAVIADCLYGSKNITYTAIKGNKEQGFSFYSPKAVTRVMDEKNPMQEPPRYGKGHRFLSFITFGKFKPETLTEKFERANEHNEEAIDAVKDKVLKLERSINVRIKKPFAAIESSLRETEKMKTAWKRHPHLEQEKKKNNIMENGVHIE